MEVKIINEEKNKLDIELGSLTIAEILRVYLNKEGAKLAAWKRDHPTKNPILHIEADNPKKLLKKAIATLEKEIDKTVDEFKKLK
jgi:DNA-directed RNA polymerase subunit L